MASRTDNFNRADGALNASTPSDGGSAWSAPTDNWRTISNEVREQNGASNSVCWLDCGSADAEVQATMTTVPVDGHMGVCCRVSDATHVLFFRYNVGGGQLELWKNDGGSFTSHGTASYTASNGDVLKLTASGDTINCYVNGVLKIGPITDSFNNTITSHGLYSSVQNTGRMDDLAITVGGGGGDNGGTIIFGQVLAQQRN